MARELLSRPGVVAIQRLLRAIARAHERARHAFEEAARQRPFAIAIELLRRDESLHGKMIHGRTQILAEREDVDVDRAQVVHGLRDLFVRFAEAEHEARLGEHFRVVLLRVLEHAQRSARSSHADRAPDGVRRRTVSTFCANTSRPESTTVSTSASTPWKSGVSASTAVCGAALLDGTDAVRVVLRAAVGQIVPIHGGQHHVLELHELDGAGHVLRFFGVEPAVRVAGVDRAEAAGARTDGAHQHDGAGTGVPALPDVGALGLFADGGQAVLPNHVLDGREPLATRRPGLAARGACEVRPAAALPSRALMPSRMAVKPWGVTYFSPLRECVDLRNDRNTFELWHGRHCTVYRGRRPRSQGGRAGPPTGRRVPDREVRSILKPC